MTQAFGSDGVAMAGGGALPLGAPDAVRDANADRTGRIIMAASELIEGAGLDGLTIRAVLEKTGLSRRAYYERFVGKDDLLLAVFEQTIRWAASHFREQISALPDPMERLKTIVTGIAVGRPARAEGPYEQSSRFGAAMSREHLRLAESRPDDLRGALSPLITLMEEQISAGIQAGLVRQDDPYFLATLVYNLLSTTVHTALLAQETGRSDAVRREELAADIWEFCRRGIAAEPDGERPSAR